MSLQRHAKQGGDGGKSSSQKFELRGQTFQQSGDIIAFLSGIENKNDRFRVQVEALEAMLQYHDRASDMIEDVFLYVQKDAEPGALSSSGSLAELVLQAAAIIDSNRARRDRHLEASKAAGCNWNSQIVDWLKSINPSATFMGAVRALSKAYSIEDAAVRVNRAFIARLDVPRKGHSTKPIIQTADLMEAAKTGEIAPVGVAEMQRFRVKVGKWGFLERGELLDFNEPGGSDMADGSEASDCNMAGGSETTRSAREGSSHFPSPAGEMSHAVPGRAAAAGGDDDLDGDDIDGDDDKVDGALLRSIQKELENEAKELNEAAGAKAGTDGDDDDGERPLKRRRLDSSDCRCSAEVSRGWKASVIKIKEYDMATNFKLLKSWQSWQSVCYPHTKATGSHMGLRIKQLKAKQLADRLQYIHEHRLEIGKLKTDPATFTWFRVKNRPQRPSDFLGPYNFAHADPPAAFHYDQEALSSWIGGFDREQWNMDGSISVDLFSWWFDTPIGEIVLKEYDMYRHHLREINGKSNYGWLRNMLYSIGQQLMQQDPKYYATYAALRPDRHWRLVAYPYYAKFAVVGDNTYFRHLDLNIPLLIKENRGGAMIQGSVSIDDEVKPDCTVILPGMQHKLAQWWERVLQRGPQKDGYVFRITDQMFSEDDAKVLGINWKEVPCKRGEARITLPHLPHGANGPAHHTRRTMLPWFVSLQDDMTTLEMVESGTWEELSAAHRDMVSPKSTPSGLANRYGSIPYKFPAAVEISGLSSLSDALVCRRRWDSLSVLRDRDILLTGPRCDADQYIKEWRGRAVAAAEGAFRLVIQREKEAFGERSYFYHLERLENLGIPFPRIKPDDAGECADDELTAEKGGVAGRLHFAEEGITSTESSSAASSSFPTGSEGDEGSIDQSSEEGSEEDSEESSEKGSGEGTE